MSDNIDKDISFFSIISKMHVQELLIYPVKSCAGVKVQEALVTKYGLALPSDPRIFDRSSFFFGMDQFMLL